MKVVKSVDIIYIWESGVRVCKIFKFDREFDIIRIYYILNFEILKDNVIINIFGIIKLIM